MKQHTWGLFLLTSLSLLAYGGMVRIHWLYSTLRDGHTPQTIAWYLLAFFAYLSAILWAEKRGIPQRWLWGAAILFRLLLLFTTPTLSDDVYRYLWDGYVAHQGVSPYAHAINSPELDYLDNPVRVQANNAWMASPYLPAAQMVFWSVTAVAPLLTIALLIPFGLQAGWGLSGELDGTGLFGALRIYGSQWNFNSGLFHWLEVWLGKQGVIDTAGMGKLIVFSVFGVLITAVFLLARTRSSSRDTLRLMAVPFMGYVLLTPTLHPWYSLILLAFLPFLPPAQGEGRWRWLAGRSLALSKRGAHFLLSNLPGSAQLW